MRVDYKSCRSIAQPNLSSYYKFIEGGCVIQQNFTIHLFFEIDKGRGRTHHCMQISKSKKVEYVGHMEEKLLAICRELNEPRDREQIMRSLLQGKNTWLRT